MMRIAVTVLALAASLPVLAQTPTHEVAARFATTECELPCQNPQTREWYFWRQPDRVEIRDAQGRLGEIWRREPGGRLSYVYLEPNQRRGIEYTAVDLGLIHVRRDWAQLTGMVSPAVLARLTAGEETRFLGRRAVIYKGRLGDQEVEVTWLPELELAARVAYAGRDRRTVSELRAFLSDKDEVAATTEERLRGYSLVDFADLGDMETQPDMGWLKQALAAPGHEHHEH